MGKLPKPSLFVLSLIGALAVGPPGLEVAWEASAWGREEVGEALEVGWTATGNLPPWVAQTPATTPSAETEAAPVLALAPNGQYLVRGTEEGTLEWLDDQGQATNVAVPQAHQGPVLAIAITRDGQTVISAGADGTLRRWDQRGNALGEAMLSQGTIVALALSPDGQILLGGRPDGLVEQWSVAEGTPLGDPIAAHAAAIQALNYMAGGQTWMTGSQDGSWALWNADGSQAGQVNAAHSGGITQIVGSPDGQVIATTGGDGTLRFWERATLQPRGDTLVAHGAPIRAVAYSPDGQRMATAAADGTLRLWNGDGMSLWGGPVTLTSDPRFMGFTPAGDLVLGTSDGRVERRGPQGNVIAVTRPSSPSANTPARSDDWVSQLQRLPQNTWWILAAVPALLIGVGAVGSMLGGTRSQDEAEEESDNLDPGNLDPGNLDTTAASGDVSEVTPKVPPAPLTDDAAPAMAPQPEAAADLAAFSLDAPGDLPPEANLTWDIPSPDHPANPAPANLAQNPAPEPAPEGVSASTPLPPEVALVPPPTTVPQPPTSKLEQARADLAEGRKCLREGLYEAGLLCFNSAIEATEVERLKAETQGTLLGGINALATQAQTQRGHALALLDQSGNAMDSYNTALALDSSAVEAWIGKGRLLIAMGRYEEALFCFDSALELDSSLGPAWAGKAQALLRLGRLAEGQTCHNRALALGSESLGPLPPYPTLDPATLGASAPATPSAWPGGEVIGPSPADDDLDLTADPDVPLALQQVVMGLPSADTDLAYAFPSDYGIPPELAEDVAQLPSQAESSSAETAWAMASSAPVPPIPPDVGTAPWIRPAPPPADVAADPDADTELDIPERDLPSPRDLSVAANWNPEQGWPTPKATAIDPSALVSPEPPPTVAAQPGDFVPPLEFADEWPQDLPPEVIAAMASIPAGSADAFRPQPAVVHPGPPQETAAFPAQSWIRLTLDRTQGPRFYALWHLTPEDRRQAKQAGGDILAIRLYDVTGHPTQTPLPPPVEEQRCHDDFAQDWYLAIPQWDRIYLAEIGYLASGGAWQVMARSSEVPAIAER